MKSINPATGELLVEFEPHTPSETQKRIELAHSQFQNFSTLGFLEKSELLTRLAKILKTHSRELARLATQEMGKPITQALAEVEKCAWVCEFYAENAASFLGRESVKTDASESFVSYQPLGVVLAVMPWNFPYWQLFRCAAPAMMAGNTVLLKHASNVTGCSLKIEEMFLEAGFPEGAFQSLKLSSKNVAEVIANPKVRGVSLTGSTPAGRAVAAQAGECLKKCVLELGGSDAYVVLEDANLMEAAKICAWARVQNAGQSCIAAKRFIVVEAIYEEFLKQFAKELASYKPGDPLDEETQLGPMARVDLRDDLHAQVQKSVKQGAELVFGGSCPEGSGAYYPVTLLAGVRPGMVAFDEELFGPVAAVTQAKDEAEALALANHSDFGLGAAVFTKNLQKGKEIAEEGLQAGACFVNSFVRSDPRLPFGGIKDSGLGRELGAHGIREFTNVKTVYIS